MISDIWTVAWREWKHITSQSRDRRRMAAGAAAILIVLAGIERLISFRSIIEAAPETSLIWILIWFPLGSAVTLAIDAFAGERERHTLETLLASRLPEFAILVGKIAAVVAYSWVIVIGVALGGLVAINLGSIWDEGFFLYPTTVLLLGPPASLLTAAVGASAGVLASLRAPTIRHANTRLFMALTVLPFLGIAVLVAATVLIAVPGFMLLETNEDLLSAIPVANDTVLAIAGVVVGVTMLMLFVTLLIVIARIRFQRQHMIVTESGRSLRERLFGRRSPAEPDEPQPEHVATVPDPASVSRGAGESIPYRVDGPAMTDVTTSGVRNLAYDTWAVVWKEWRELVVLYREWRAGFWFSVVFIGLMVFQLSLALSGFWLDSAAVSIVWWLAAAAVLPLLIAPRIAESIAGERERHTGEILFASRLEGITILVGKLVVATIPAWVLTLGIPLIGVVTVNLIGEQEGLILYPAREFAAGFAVTILAALLIGSIGLLVSMEAETTQQAAKWLAWIIVPYLLVPGLGFRELFQRLPDSPDESSANAAGRLPDFVLEGGLAQAALLAAALMLLAVLALLYVASRRFRRGTVVFD